MITKTLKLKKLNEKLMAAFIEYVDENNPAFLDFLMKNNFSYSLHKNILVIYKYGICDNTLSAYVDADDIKHQHHNVFNVEFKKHLSEFEVDIESHYNLSVDVCNYNLLEYSKINILANDFAYPKEILTNLLKTNLVDNLELQNKIDKNQIYIYQVQYAPIKILSFLNANKKFKQLMITSYIIAGVLAIAAIILTMKYY